MMSLVSVYPSQHLVQDVLSPFVVLLVLAFPQQDVLVIREQLDLLFTMFVPNSISTKYDELGPKKPPEFDSPCPVKLPP